MTAPRQILPGSTYLVTRRCTQRQFLLRPDKKTTAIVEYCLGEAAMRFGIELIAWVALSNHAHLVLHDPRGELPAFLQRFHLLTARALNTRWSRWENLWASEQTCATRLIADEDVFDKVVYALANPVADHLVDRVFDWPGSCSLRFTGGRTLIRKRPKIFFRDGGTMPEEVTIVATVPRGWKTSPKTWVDRVHAAVQQKERAAREQRLATNMRVVGRKKILATSAFDRPATHEPRRNLRPSIACRSTERRIRELGALRRFRAAYAHARERFAAGKRSVVFPYGTYLLRVAFGVRCAAPP